MQELFDIFASLLPVARILLHDCACLLFILADVLRSAARHVTIACADCFAVNLEDVEVPSIDTARIGERVMVAEQRLGSAIAD